MTAPKQGCLILLNACCLESSLLTSPMGGTKSQGEDARSEVEDVHTGKWETPLDLYCLTFF